MKFAAPVSILFFCAAFFPALAGGIEPVRFDSPELEHRYKNLIKELRCLVCQNQTVAESDAELAADMRAAVAKLLREGKSDADIADFVAARYGDFAFYRPPLKTKTAPLWLAPFALVLLLLFLLPRFFRRRRAGLDESQKQRAAEILDEEL